MDLDYSSTEGLKQVQFGGFIRVKNLKASGCQSIPRRRGIYLVVRDSPDAPTFLPKSVGGHFKGEDPTVSVETLTAKWVHDTVVLYVGQTGTSLQKRIKAYMDFGSGKSVGHKGGRYIWQLADHDELKVCWCMLEDGDPREAEKATLQDFSRQYSCLPFANLVG